VELETLVGQLVVEEQQIGSEGVDALAGVEWDILAAKLAAGKLNKQ